MTLRADKHFILFYVAFRVYWTPIYVKALQVTTNTLGLLFYLHASLLKLSGAYLVELETFLRYLR